MSDSKTLQEQRASQHDDVTRAIAALQTGDTFGAAHRASFELDHGLVANIVARCADYNAIADALGDLEPPRLLVLCREYFDLENMDETVWKLMPAVRRARLLYETSDLALGWAFVRLDTVDLVKAYRDFEHQWSEDRESVFCPGCTSSGKALLHCSCEDDCPAPFTKYEGPDRMCRDCFDVPSTLRGWPLAPRIGFFCDRCLHVALHHGTEQQCECPTGRCASCGSEEQILCKGRMDIHAPSPAGAVSHLEDFVTAALEEAEQDHRCTVCQHTAETTSAGL